MATLLVTLQRSSHVCGAHRTTVAARTASTTCRLLTTRLDYLHTYRHLPNRTQHILHRGAQTHRWVPSRPSKDPVIGAVYVSTRAGVNRARTTPARIPFPIPHMALMRTLACLATERIIPCTRRTRFGDAHADPRCTPSKHSLVSYPLPISQTVSRVRTLAIYVPRRTRFTPLHLSSSHSLPIPQLCFPSPAPHRIYRRTEILASPISQ